MCADPSQIQIVSNTTHGAASGRHLLQQPASNSSEGASLQIQITPTPDQASPMALACITPSRCLYACLLLPSHAQLCSCRPVVRVRCHAAACGKMLQLGVALQCNTSSSPVRTSWPSHSWNTCSSPSYWLSVMLHLQRASVLDALRQPNFNTSLRNSLAAQGACT